MGAMKEMLIPLQDKMIEEGRKAVQHLYDIETEYALTECPTDVEELEQSVKVAIAKAAVEATANAAEELLFCDKDEFLEEIGYCKEVI